MRRFDGRQNEKTLKTIQRHIRSIRYWPMLGEKLRNWQRKDHTILLSFLIPAAILWIAFLSRYTFPLGNRNVLLIDLYHQYAPFLSGLRNKLLTFGNLTYSWSGGLGTSFIPLIAYYLASPLNLLLVLFPKSFLTEAVLLFILVKTGLAGAFFAFYLNRIHHRKGLMVIAFSSLYALSGYMLAYFWNIMWLEGIYLLPLIILGLIRLVKDGRYLLYTITLGLLLFSNFYIAFFVCIFVLLYFPVALVQNGIFRDFKKLMKRTGQFAAFSLIAAGMSAVLLIPTYYALKLTSAYGESMPHTLSSYFDVFDFFSRHLAIAAPSIRDGMPNLYCGVAVLIMVPLYLMSRSIPLREKLSNLALLAVMIVSFNTNVLNFIWHGFHFPNQLPFRNSFVYIFVLVSMAFNASGRLKEFTGRQIGAVCAAIAAFVLIAQKLDENAANPVFIYVNLAIVTIYAAVLTLHRIRPLSVSTVYDRVSASFSAVGAATIPRTDKPASRLRAPGFSHMILMFFIVILLEMMANTVVTMDWVDNNEHFSARNGYLAQNDTPNVEKALKHIAAMDKGFYRIELFPPKTTNDPFLYNYRGLSIFASTFQRKPVGLMERLGFHSNGINSYQYEGSTLVLDSLFGIKYLIRRSGDVEEYLRKPLQIQDISVYENPYALQVGFIAPADFGEWKNGFTDPFKTQNSFMTNLCGIDDVIVPLELTKVHTSNTTINKSLSGDYEYKKSSPGKEATITLQMTMDQDRQVSLYIDTKPKLFKSGKATLKDRTINFNAIRSSLVDLGYFHTGDVVDIQLVLSEDAAESGDFDIIAGALDMDAFEKAFSILKDRCIVIDSFGDSFIKGRIDASAEGTMVMTIPYDKGWHVEVDGKSVETYALDNCLLCFDISAGNHTINMKYTAEKLMEGLAVTALSIAVLLTVMLFSARRIRKKTSE